MKQLNIPTYAAHTHTHTNIISKRKSTWSSFPLLLILAGGTDSTTRENLEKGIWFIFIHLTAWWFCWFTSPTHAGFSGKRGHGHLWSYWNSFSGKQTSLHLPSVLGQIIEWIHMESCLWNVNPKGLIFFSFYPKVSEKTVGGWTNINLVTIECYLLRNWFKFLCCMSHCSMIVNDCICLPYSTNSSSEKRKRSFQPSKTRNQHTF